jgi:hypothetical protein
MPSLAPHFGAAEYVVLDDFGKRRRPDPWAAAVLVDEFDARCLKGVRQRRHSGSLFGIIGRRGRQFLPAAETETVPG